MHAAGSQPVLRVYAPQNSTFTVAPHPGRETEARANKSGVCFKRRSSLKIAPAPAAVL